MPEAHYKVFLVEDEIVTREGIRDNVPWEAAGFQFCGEAPDGEMALPLILAERPDVLITDIKMPFMDGLELARLARQSLPALKIIILSGHDEFHYAQAAITVGVTEYLLKPIGVQDLAQILRKLAAQLDQERTEQEQLRQLKHQAADHLAAQRERFLLSLAAGTMAAGEALEKGHALGLELAAQAYQVLLLRPKQNSVGAGNQIEQIIAALVNPNPDVLWCKKGSDEFVLILKGKNAAQLQQDSTYLAETIREQAENQAHCALSIGFGKPCERLGSLGQSFAQAESALQQGTPPEERAGLSDFAQMDDAGILEYLKFGEAAHFDDFFAHSVAPQGRPLSRIFLDYIVINTTLSAARYIRSLGGDPAQVLPELAHIETWPLRSHDLPEAREYLRAALAATLAFRDRQPRGQTAMLIEKAKRYIDENFTNADLSLGDVALRIGLSASHFSFLFSRATGQTFKDYLTGLRIQRAKELLRSTDQSAAEIAERVGYNDPHYFSAAFKKESGLTPRDFRAQKAKPAL